MLSRKILFNPSIRSMIKRTCCSKKIIMTEKEQKIIEIYSITCCIGGVIGSVGFAHDVYKRERKVYNKLECIINATFASIVGFAVGFTVVGTLPITLPIASVVGIIVAIFDNDSPPSPFLPLLIDNYDVHDRKPT